MYTKNITMVCKLCMPVLRPALWFVGKTETLSLVVGPCQSAVPQTYFALEAFCVSLFGRGAN
jgi:hypothetical protein